MSETVMRLAADIQIRPEREHHCVWLPKYVGFSGSRTKHPHTGAAQKQRRKHPFQGLQLS